MQVFKHFKAAPFMYTFQSFQTAQAAVFAAANAVLSKASLMRANPEQSRARILIDWRWLQDTIHRAVRFCSSILPACSHTSRATPTRCRRNSYNSSYEARIVRPFQRRRSNSLFTRSTEKKITQSQSSRRLALSTPTTAAPRRRCMRCTRVQGPFSLTTTIPRLFTSSPRASTAFGMNSTRRGSSLSSSTWAGASPSRHCNPISRPTSSRPALWKASSNSTSRSSSASFARGVLSFRALSCSRRPWLRPFSFQVRLQLPEDDPLRRCLLRRLFRH